MYTVLLKRIINRIFRLKALLKTFEALKPVRITFFGQHKDNILLTI